MKQTRTLLSCLLCVCFMLALTGTIVPERAVTAADGNQLWDADDLLDTQWYLEALGARSLWAAMEAKGRSPGEGVVIAVIDTGVSMIHTDLFDNVWVNEAEYNGIEGVDDDGNGYIDDVNGVNLYDSYHNMTDSYGHGTAMSGLIAMGAGNGGGAGIAYGSKVMPIKVGKDNNLDDELVVEGICYAMENGADIINMSFGTYYPSEQLKEAIEAASETCILVAAAGNETCATSEKAVEGYESGELYPAAYDQVIGVMAETRDGLVTSTSNVDSVPGTGVDYEMIAPGEQLYTCTTKRRYQYVNGTSPAAALVAGTLAVYRSIYADRVAYPAKELQNMFLESQKHRIDVTLDADTVNRYKELNLNDLLPDVEHMTEEIKEIPSSPVETRTPVSDEASSVAAAEPMTAIERHESTSIPDWGEMEEKTGKTGVAAEKWCKGRPDIQKKYKGSGKNKAVLHFRLQKADQYRIYRYSKRKKRYVLWKKTVHKYLTVKGKGTKWYVIACREISGRLYKSNRSRKIKL